MKTTTTEVAPDVYQISTYIPDVRFQFNQFLVKDDQPLLYHTGMRALFPVVHEAVAKVLDPRTLRWIGFSHFEADECGALDEWLRIAPDAEAVCGVVSALVSMNDQASRPPRAVADGEGLETGARRFRFVATPHCPHGWDAVHVFEENDRTLLCSDLFHQMGDVEPLTADGDIVGRYEGTLAGMQETPLAGYVPYGEHTNVAVDRLAVLEPQTILPMHGSAYRGDGRRVLLDMKAMLARTLGP